MPPTRQAAWQLLNEYIKTANTLKHCLAVEAAMKVYAKKYNEAEEKWAIAGLLHDFDYEKYPDQHPQMGSEILRGLGYPEDIIDTILGHTNYTGVPRESQMAKCLFAVDELCGFIIALAYVRPDKLNGMTPKSVKKALKKKAFAANVSREEIAQGIEELGIERDEHFKNVIQAMQEMAKDLGF
ncbi:MAG: HD domain-containing protein [Patescibacteria group bacterium]